MLGRNRWVIFGVGSALFLLSMFYRSSSAIIAPDLSRDLNLDFDQLGLLGGAFFYSFALVQLPMGLILDRVGTRLTLVCLNLIGAAGGLFFAGSESVTAAVAGRALLGLGMAGNLIGVLQLLTKWFPPGRFATMQGVLLSIATCGAMLATSPLAMLVKALGWRGSFYLLAGLNLVLVILVALLVKDSPGGEQPVEDRADPEESRPVLKKYLKTLLLNRDYWLISWSTFLRYGAYASIQALWAGPFLILYLGLDTITAGWYLMLMNIGFVIGAPLLGWISEDLIGSRKRTILAGLVLMTLCVALLGIWPGGFSRFWLAVVFFFVGFTSTAGNLMYPHIKNLMPTEMSGTAMAGINFFTMAGAGLFTQGLGRVLTLITATQGQGEAYRSAFLICAGALALTICLYLFTREDEQSRQRRVVLGH